jgi:hypothetical protein
LPRAGRRFKRGRAGRRAETLDVPAVAARAGRAVAERTGDGGERVLAIDDDAVAGGAAGAQAGASLQSSCWARSRGMSSSAARAPPPARPTRRSRSPPARRRSPRQLERTLVELAPQPTGRGQLGARRSPARLHPLLPTRHHAAHAGSVRDRCAGATASSA